MQAAKGLYLVLWGLKLSCAEGDQGCISRQDLVAKKASSQRKTEARTEGSTKETTERHTCGLGQIGPETNAKAHEMVYFSCAN